MRKIKLIFSIFTIFTLFLMIEGCSKGEPEIKGEPDISENCSVNAFGKVSCTFSNSGTAKGSACYTTMFVRTYDKDRYYNGYGKPGVGEIMESSGEMCSGIVEPGDVVDREQSFSFIAETGGAREPNDFCQLRPRTGRYERDGPWYRGCDFSSKKVSK